MEDGSFRLDRETSDEINSIIARHEVIEPGVIRGTGQVHGGGTVDLPGVGTVPGDSVGDDGLQLVRDHANLLAVIAGLEDPREQALAYGCSATRSQFYHDGNKRTSRIMMAGHLMAHGFEPVSVPYGRLLEYNEALITLFSTDDATDLMDFFTTCTQPK